MKIIIGTMQGLVDICNPNPSQIDFDDTCRTLGNICRFNGRGNRFYSVAQHLIVVSEILADHASAHPDADLIRLGGLCHDFPESLTGDFISPVKKNIPWIEEVEGSILDSMGKVFSLGEYDHYYVKTADMIACYREAISLGFDTSDWSCFSNELKAISIPESAQWWIDRYILPHEAGAALISHYLEITEKESSNV